MTETTVIHVANADASKPVSPDNEEYTPHNSPFSVITEQGVVEAACMSSTTSVAGYMTLQDVFSKTHQIQMAHKDDLRRLNACDTIMVSFEYSGCMVHNTYERVLCTHLNDFLPLWELTKQVRKVGIVHVYEWTVHHDAAYYKATDKLYSKQRALDAQLKRDKDPDERLVAAANSVQEEIEALSASMTKPRRPRDQFGRSRRNQPKA